MGEHKLRKPKQSRQQKDISEDLAVITEVGAYQALQEVMDLAFKKGGFFGVLEAAIRVIKDTDQAARVAEEEAPGCPNLHRATVAAPMQMQFLPAMAEQLKKLPDGPYYWELADGGTTEFPEPGQRLRTAEESRRITRKYIDGFEQFKLMVDAGVTPLPSFFEAMANP